MYTLVILTFVFLPMFHAERHQMEVNNNQGMFLPHSSAANYLLRWPMRQYQNPSLDSTVDRSSLFTSSDQHIPHEQQRMKRIYWENLAFHAADFNQKNKKV